MLDPHPLYDQVRAELERKPPRDPGVPQSFHKIPSLSRQITWGIAVVLLLVGLLVLL